MKKIIASLILVSALAVQAQSSGSFSGGLQQIGDAVSSSTNWTAIAGYGHSTSGNKSLLFADIAYNFNQNVGIVGGYDYLFGNGNSQANIVKGGVTLSLPMHPFAFLGSTFATNITCTPFVADLLATPKNSGAGIGNIMTTGVNFDVYSFKNFELGAGVQIEKRTGQGDWDGSYYLVHLAISRKF